MLTAIRANEDLMLGNYWGWPSSFDLVENYRAVFTGTPILRFLVNSFIITLPSVLFVLVLSTLAGFALSRYRFRGSTLILGLFIAGNFIPPQILMIPVRNLMTALGLYDTFWALIIFHTAFQTGFATMFMRAFIAQLPSELFEAARVDGATPLQMLSMIVTPLVRPALAALGVLTFTFVWNEYFWALILVQSDQVKPVTLGLATLKGQYITAWNLVSAATIFVALPPVLLFFLMQKHFVAGLTVGAVKG
nr:carbohydrate ABC transporter permease [Chelativorans sp.]